MRFKMMGYGKFHYLAQSGHQVEWPVVGVALQKSYISVYLSVTKDGAPLVQSYAGRLGECRMGRNNFSFVRFDDLNSAIVSALLTERTRSLMRLLGVAFRQRAAVSHAAIFILQSASPVRGDTESINDLPSTPPRMSTEHRKVYLTRWMFSHLENNRRSHYVGTPSTRPESLSVTHRKPLGGLWGN
jgi:hypothetical protein